MLFVLISIELLFLGSLGCSLRIFTSSGIFESIWASKSKLYLKIGSFGEILVAIIDWFIYWLQWRLPWFILLHLEFDQWFLSKCLLIRLGNFFVEFRFSLRTHWRGLVGRLLFDMHVAKYSTAFDILTCFYNSFLIVRRSLLHLKMKRIKAPVYSSHGTWWMMVSESLAIFGVLMTESRFL